MGKKFTSMHVSSSCEDLLNGLLCDDETALRLAEDWITVWSETLDYRKNVSRARNLSKQLPGLLVYTEYFDDDIAEITVLREGLKRCGYLNNEGQKYLSKPSVWETELSLDKEEMQALRLVTKTGEGPSFDISRIGGIIGAPLYMGGEPAVQDGPSVLYTKDKAATREFVRQQAKLRAIKNHTKLTLLYEKPGQYVGGKVKDRRCVIQMLLSQEGRYDLGHVYCYTARAEHFEPFYDYVRPPRIFPPGSTWMQEIWINPKQLQLFAYEKWVLVNADNTVDGDAYEADLYGDKRDMLSSKPDWLTEPFRFTTKYEANNQILEKKARDQSVLAASVLPDSLCPKSPLLASDRLVCFCRNRMGTQWEVLFYDLDLNLLERRKLPSFPGNGVGHQQVYSPHHDAVFFCQYDGSVAAYYLGTQTLLQTCLERGSSYLWGFDHRHHLLYSPSWGTFYVIDENLKILSRHRIKGELKFFYTADNGKTRVVTADKYVESEQVPAKEPKVRIYELEYPQSSLPAAPTK